MLRSLFIEQKQSIDDNLLGGQFPGQSPDRKAWKEKNVNPPRSIPIEEAWREEVWKKRRLTRNKRKNLLVRRKKLNPIFSVYFV